MAFALCVCVACLLFVAHCCSYVEIPVPDKKSPNGTKYVIGRTNELANLLGHTAYRIAFYPAEAHGQRFKYIAVEGFESIAGFNSPGVAADGMNEAGLTLACQTLRESKYQGTVPSQPHDLLAQELVSEVLKNCEDVEDALQFLAQRRVVGPSGAAGFHWAIADASGRSVVVEYIRGKRVVWENTPRVMTNDPPLDWHWRNLDTYVNLNPEFPHQNDFLAVDTEVGTVPNTVGHGFNLFGLPGDTSPASRYVQLFYLRGYALKTAAPASAEDAIVLGTALLNKVFIPLGTVGADSRSKWDGPEYTPFAIIKIPSERRLLVRGYRNVQWREIDLTKLKSTKPLSWPVEDGTLGIQDITSMGIDASRDVSV